MFCNQTKYSVSNEISSITKWFFFYLFFQCMSVYFLHTEHNDDIIWLSHFALIFVFFALLNGFRRLEIARIKNDVEDGDNEWNFAIFFIFVSAGLLYLHQWFFDKEYSKFIHDEDKIGEFEPSKSIYAILITLAISNFLIFLWTGRLSVKAAETF